MPLTLKESFNNVKVICDNALTNKVERVAVDESLNNIAGALQAHELMLQASKGEKSQLKEKPQLEDEPDEFASVD